MRSTPPAGSGAAGRPGRCSRRSAARSRALIADQYRVLNAEVLPALEKAGVRLVRRTEFTAAERAWVARYFEREVRPLLDADRARPGAPVSAGRQQEPQLRDRALRPRRVRTRRRHRDRQGAARRPAGDQAAERGRRRRQRVRDAVVGDPRPPARALRRPRRRQLFAVPRHPRRRPVDRRGGGEEPAPGAAGRAAAAAVRLGRAARGRRRRARTGWRGSCCSSSSSARTTSIAAMARSISRGSRR